MAEFTTDDIVCAYEIPGVYDGTSAYLLKDGTIVNRWAHVRGFCARRKATQHWIDQHADQIRATWSDELEGGKR